VGYQIVSFYIFVAMTTTIMPEKTHHGRAVKRIREILHIKQDVLADALGISQQSISLLETKETLEPEQLEQIARTFKVPVEAIKNFNEEAAVSYINTFHDNSISHVIGNYGTYNFNPIDKWLEAIEENKKLHAALLKEKDEKIALLEKMLAEKKK
jgi:transcriptional regulator with XRE-family HTH domain